MDSVTVFDALIKTIESSNLNYFINKTPFSAKISLKSTFIKRFENDQTLQSDQLQLNLTEKFNSQEKKICMLERELIKLQKENIKVNDMLSEEKARLQVFNESVKENLGKNSDKGNFMSKNEDLEKGFHSMKLNYEQEISDHENTVKEKIAVKNENTKKDKLIKVLKEDKKKLEEELEMSEKNCKSLSRSLKTKEKEIYEMKKENIKIKEDLDQVKAELVKTSLNANQEKKELERKLKKVEKKDFLNNLKSSSDQTDTIPCGHCDVKLESTDKLRSHKIIHHQKNSSI